MRLSSDELMVRMQAAENMVPQGYAIRHVKTGGEYMVKSHSLRVGDLMPLVNYAPLVGPVVVFARAVTEVQSKFVRVDGKEWKGPIAGRSV